MHDGEGVIPHRPRWQYRFNNFSRALTLLREALDIDATRDFTQLEREGLIQRFEYCLELAWKTMKNVLDDKAVKLPLAALRSVVRAAFMAGLIDRGPVRMDALDARNRM